MTPEQVKGQPGTCDTVKIKADNAEGYVVINEVDFDEAKHERFEKAEKKSKVGKGG